LSYRPRISAPYGHTLIPRAPAQGFDWLGVGWPFFAATARQDRWFDRRPG